MAYGNYQSKFEAIRALENILQRKDHLSLSDNFITISEMNSIILDLNHDNHGFLFILGDMINTAIDRMDYQFLLRLLTIISELFKIESDISEIKFFENDGNEFYEALENLQNNDEFWDEIEEEKVKVEVLRLVSAFSQKLSIMLKKLLNLFQRKKKKNLLILIQNLLIY